MYSVISKSFVNLESVCKPNLIQTFSLLFPWLLYSCPSPKYYLDWEEIETRYYSKIFSISKFPDSLGCISSMHACIYTDMYSYIY